MDQAVEEAVEDSATNRMVVKHYSSVYGDVWMQRFNKQAKRTQAMNLPCYRNILIKEMQSRLIALAITTHLGLAERAIAFKTFKVALKRAMKQGAYELSTVGTALDGCLTFVSAAK